MEDKKVILITGSSGFIGSALARELSKKYKVIGLDQFGPKEKIPGVSYFDINITSETDVERILTQIRSEFGNIIYSIVHLVAYYNFNGKEDERYQTITVNGTRSLISNLRKNFEVTQFIYSSSMLVYRPVKLGEKVRDDSPLAPNWPYPKSKIATEKVLQEEQGNIPILNLRIAGVYDDSCHSPTISNQIVRIFEGWTTSVPFPGNADHGQAFLHLDDLVGAISACIDNVQNFGKFETFILGEEKALSYRDMQEKIGILIHGIPWPTIRIPAFVALTGSKVMEKLPFIREPFIKPWMIKHSDEHMEIDMTKLKRRIHWQPKKSLESTLPLMIANLKADPEKWYKINKIEKPFYRDINSITGSEEKTLVFACLFNIFMGLWLLGNPMNFINVERAEYFSEIISGALILIIAIISVIPTLRWTRWINALIGVWLLFSPLVFFTKSDAAYINDTLIGALVILASTYSPQKVKGEAAPPGWSYNPSTMVQRLPIMILAFLGYLFSRYLASYQLGHIETVWDPFFGEGTATVLTSDISKAFPISDAGLGAITYLLDVVATSIGGRDRWRSLPWAVILFGFMIIPSGVTSITLVMLQPIGVGAWCTICLITAFIMLIMVPPAVDEVLASVQFLIRRKKAGESFWKVFWFGSTEVEEKVPMKIKKVGNLAHLYICSVLAFFLMFFPTLFGVFGMAANSTYIVAALAATFSIIAMSEVARIVRLVNVPLGIWLAMSGWFLTAMDDTAKWIAVIVGILLVVLSLPRGRKVESFGKSDDFIHWTPLKG